MKSTQSRVISSHLITSLSNGHNPQTNHFVSCSFAHLCFNKPVSRKPFPRVLFSSSCFWPHPPCWATVAPFLLCEILDSSPALLETMSNHYWGGKGLMKWKFECASCRPALLVAFLLTALLLSCTPFQLFPYFKPHNSSGLSHFPARAPSIKAQLTPWSCISFLAPAFSTFAHQHQIPRLYPAQWDFFHCSRFSWIRPWWSLWSLCQPGHSFKAI